VHGPVSDDGFPAVFDRYSPAVLRFARRRAGSEDAAWDVVSDTFTAAWRNWNSRPADDALLPGCMQSRPTRSGIGAARMAASAV